jgi:phosphate:Na+ symporter
MNEIILYALGGLGLFLLGMKLMTSSLNALAGDRLQSWIASATKTPIRGVATGASVTALIQSSSATTVAAVGFVGAGLLSFEQALGVIFGANIGTTITGWLVALIGIKINLGVASLGIIFAGSMLQFIGRGNWSSIGKAIGGFGLLFLGIDYLKQGLTSVAAQINLEALGGSGFIGILIFLGVGVGISILTQSSSSTIATALVALNTSVIDLPQAMAIIVGADMGTTATAYLATLGGSLASRRAGLSHVIYNMLTGIMALSLLYPYLWGWQHWASGTLNSTPEFVAVAFHTSFNILGVILIIPFTGAFARLICKLIKSDTTSAFDYEPLTESPDQSSSASYLSLQKLSQNLTLQLFKVTQSALQKDSISATDAGKVQKHINSLRHGLLTFEPEADIDKLHQLFHGIDHLERLLARLRDHQRLLIIREDQSLEADVSQMLNNLELALTSPSDEVVNILKHHAESLQQESHRFRRQLIEHSFETKKTADHLDKQLDAHRWLERTAHHLHRSLYYVFQ